MSEQLPLWAPDPDQWPSERPEHRRRRRWLAVGGAGALAIVAAAAVAVGLTVPAAHTVSGAGQLATGTSGTTVLPRWNSGYGSNGYGGYGGGGGANGYGGYGGNGSGSGGGQQASTAQSVGVVDIDTVLGYQDGEAAGTGTVVTASGEILTNNHVIDGATKITVTVVSTGATYTAKVVGTDPTQDVAVLQLSGASGLTTAHYGTDDSLAVGQSVTGVGNAGGVGGTPSAASGTITALNRSITATDDDGSNPEKLSGLIETNAPIEAGDSGGPLYDSSGQIIGMDTAASTSGQRTAAGYAIEIEHALDIAGQIESATTSSSTIHMGLPAFLGVAFDSNASGAAVAQVLEGTPAARAGLAAGDVITRAGGHKVGSPTALQSVLAGYRPGQQIAIGWLDAEGGAHRATLTLANGPAD